VSRSGLMRSWAALALLAAVLGGCGSSSTAHSSSATTAAASAPSTTPSAPTATPTATTQTQTTPSTTTTATPTATTPAPPVQLSSIHLSSPAFSAGGTIPSQYTCDGADISLPLQWSGVPASAQELVLVMRDPNAPGGDFVHWALAGIAPGTTALATGGVPGHVVPGRNSLGTLGYRGPCPPPGDKPHQYVITLSALSSPSGLSAGFSADQLTVRAVALGTLVGTYARR
jgi:Raf kinase inhibitor-like YbhB/YbcL family protein